MEKGALFEQWIREIYDEVSIAISNSDSDDYCYPALCRAKAKCEMVINTINICKNQ